MELSNEIKENNFTFQYFSLAFFLILIYLDVPFRIVGEFLFYMSFMFHFIYKNKSFTLFSLWSLLMISLAGLSIFWTPDLAQSLIELRIMIQMATIGFLLIGFVNSEEKLISVYKTFVVAGVGLVLFLLFAVPFEAFLDPTTRIGADMGTNMENVTQNANDIGLNLTISAIFTFYLHQKEKKWFYIPLLVLFLYLIFLTGSRKAIALSVAGILITLVLNSSSSIKLIRSMFISFILLIIVIYSLLNIPFLYEIAGRRIESLILMMFGVGGGDVSTLTRQLMVARGMEMISERPLFGFGVGSYSKASGIGTYSHNNYIELGVGLGLFGILTYYSIYMINIFRLIKNIKFKILIPLVVLSVFLPIIEIGLVTYNIFTWNIIIALSFAAVRIKMTNNETI